VNTGRAAIEAWIKHYPQLNVLRDEVEGFEDFLIVIANNLLRDNKFGRMFRVATGALISSTDMATDVYALMTYYQSDGLVSHANALLGMICANLLLQTLCELIEKPKKDWLLDILYIFLFVRPIVDAYRVSTINEYEETTIDPLTEVSERSTDFLAPCKIGRNGAVRCCAFGGG